MVNDLTPEAIAREFVRRRRIHRWLVAPIAGVALVILALKSSGADPGPWYVWGVVVALACLVANFLIWRCPACGAFLGRRDSPSYCQNCGTQLDA